MNDTISRQAAIDALHGHFTDGFNEDRWWNSTHVLTAIKNVPSAEPQIIYCKDCEKHNKARGYSYDGTFVGIVDACPLVEIRGKAQGHEFDYQYCVYAKRRTDG